MAIDAAALRVVVSADTSKAESGLQSFSGKMKSMAGGLGAVGTAMSLGITTPLVGIAVGAVKTAASFERSMNILEYSSRATAEQMQAMSDQALQLGADTVFSANEAAEGMVELSKAGMDTEDVMAAIPGVMDLAAAGAISVGEAANLAAATVNTFGLEASKTTEVADILAAAANASAADITDLAFGVQNAGSVFATSGQSVETLATMMALLANNGLNASDAATSLKTMTMRLTAPTDKAAKVMKNLGIAVFDADGNMRDYHDIIADMEAATVGMSDATRAAAFNTIFGADAIRAANILVSEGVTGYEQMATAVGEQGAAAAMAEAQNSGLAGAMEQISGSIDTVMTKLALPFLDTLAEWGGKLAEFVNSLGELPQPAINAGLAVAGFAAALGAVLLAAAGIAGVIGALMTPIGAVVLVVLGLAAAVGLLWAAWELNWGNIQGKTETALGVINPLLTTLGSSLSTAATDLGSAATAVGVLLAFNPQWSTFIAGVKGAATAAGNLAASLGAAVTNFKMPDLSTLQTSALKTNVEMQLIATIRSIQLDLSGVSVEQIRSSLQSGLTNALNQIKFEQVGQGLVTQINKLSDQVNKLDLTGIDWSAVLTRLLLGPIGVAVNALAWVFGAKDFEPLRIAVTNGITTIPWGDLGTAFGGLGKAILGQLVKIANDIIADLSAAFTALTGITLTPPELTILPFPPQTIDPPAVTITEPEFDFSWENVGMIPTRIVSSLTSEITGGDWEGVGTILGNTIVSTWEGNVRALGALITFNSFLETFKGSWSALQIAIGFEIAKGFDITEFTAAVGRLGAAIEGALTAMIERVIAIVGALMPGGGGSSTAGVAPPTVGGTPDLGGERGGGGFPQELPMDELIPGWADTSQWSGFMADQRGGAPTQEPLDWSLYVKPLKWQEFVTPVKWETILTAIQWRAHITRLDWDQFVQRAEWERFVAPLTWSAFVTALSWNQYVQDIQWSNFISDIAWGNFVSELAWGAYVPALDWSRFIPMAPVTATAGSGGPGGQGGTTGAGITVVIENVEVNNGMDIEELVTTIARRLQQKLRL